MREHLYRGKRKDNGEWVEGYYVKRVTAYGLCENPNFLKESQIWHNNGDCCGRKGQCNSEVIPETVGEWTGLTDRNGKKIFEGDILRGDIPDCLAQYKGCVGEVIYEKSAFLVDMSKTRDPWNVRKVGFCSFCNYEIIGNAYDNPELLEKG